MKTPTKTQQIFSSTPKKVSYNSFAFKKELNRVKNEISDIKSRTIVDNEKLYKRFTF